MIVKQALFCLCKSRLNPLLKTTSTKQWRLSFLIKKTRGEFDGSWTHDWPFTCQTYYRLRHASPKPSWELPLGVSLYITLYFQKSLNSLKSTLCSFAPWKLFYTIFNRKIFIILYTWVTKIQIHVCIQWYFSSNNELERESFRRWSCKQWIIVVGYCQNCR